MFGAVELLAEKFFDVVLLNRLILVQTISRICGREHFYCRQGQHAGWEQ